MALSTQHCNDSTIIDKFLLTADVANALCPENARSSEGCSNNVPTSQIPQYTYQGRSCPSFRKEVLNISLVKHHWQVLCGDVPSGILPRMQFQYIPEISQEYPIVDMSRTLKTMLYARTPCTAAQHSGYTA